MSVSSETRRDPIEQAKRYQDAGADELVFYDITASHEGRGIMADLVSHVDSIVFASTGVPGLLKKQVLAGRKPASTLLRYLTR